MFVTGTGTQADPYICSTWDELISVSTTASNYIKMADSDSKLINFDDIQPTGFESQVELSGKINFNGWTLKNFYSISPIAIILKSGTTWSNLILDSFSHKYAQSSPRFLQDGSSDYASTFTGCEFSGIMEYGSGESSFIYSNNFQSLQIESCSFNISATSAGKVNLFFLKKFSDSEAIVKVNANKCTLVTGRNTSQGIAVNSRFAGKITLDTTTEAVLSGYGNSGFSIYNVESNTPIKYTGSAISVYNSDLCSVSSDSSANIKPCTALQINDATYLNSIGFVVGDGT